MYLRSIRLLASNPTGILVHDSLDKPKCLIVNEKEGSRFATSFFIQRRVRLLWRKVRDSNPRYPKRVYRISSPARSFTLPTFLLLSVQRYYFFFIHQKVAL